MLYLLKCKWVDGLLLEHYVGHYPLRHVGVHDVSGAGPTTVFRWLVVNILKLFNLAFERTQVRSRQLSLISKKKCQEMTTNNLKMEVQPTLETSCMSKNHRQWTTSKTVFLYCIKHYQKTSENNVENLHFYPRNLLLTNALLSYSLSYLYYTETSFMFVDWCACFLPQRRCLNVCGPWGRAEVTRNTTQLI
jgi:hypothetical protein